MEWNRTTRRRSKASITNVTGGGGGMSLNYPRSTIKFTHTFFFPSRSNGRLNPNNSATSIGPLLPSSFVFQQWTRSQPCTKLYRRASISVFRFRPNPNRPQFQTSFHSPLLRFVLRRNSSPFRWGHFQVDRSTLLHLPPTAFFFSITIRFTCSFNPLVLLSIFFLLYLWYFLLKIVECIDGQGRKEEILGEELPVLAKEVARVETVRAYAGQFCFYYWNKRVNGAVKYSKILLLDWFVLVVHTRLKYFAYVSQNGGFMFCCFLMIPWIGLIYFCCIIGVWVVFCGNSLHCTLSSLPNVRMDFVGYSQFPIHGSVNLKVNWSYYPQMVNPLHFCLCWWQHQIQLVLLVSLLFLFPCFSFNIMAWWRFFWVLNVGCNEIQVHMS